MHIQYLELRIKPATLVLHCSTLDHHRVDIILDPALSKYRVLRDTEFIRHSRLNFTVSESALICEIYFKSIVLLIVFIACIFWYWKTTS